MELTFPLCQPAGQLQEVSHSPEYDPQSEPVTVTQATVFPDQEHGTAVARGGAHAIA